MDRRRSFSPAPPYRTTPAAPWPRAFSEHLATEIIRFDDRRRHIVLYFLEEAISTTLSSEGFTVNCQLNFDAAFSDDDS